MNALHLLIAATSVFAGSSEAKPVCVVPDAASVAQAIVPQRHFRTMLQTTMMRTQTAQMVATRHPEAFQELFPEAIEKAVERHAETWEANLVAAYSESLTPDELVTACKAINEQDGVAFGPVAEKVGPAVQSRSEELLKSAGVEVLSELWTAVSAKPAKQ